MKSCPLATRSMSSIVTSHRNTYDLWVLSRTLSRNKVGLQYAVNV